MNAETWPGRHLLTSPQEAKGRLVYRPGCTAALGIVGGSMSSAALAPRWFVTGVPPLWSEDDFRAWASERGFLDVSAIKRQGRKAWFMLARPPPSLSVDSGVTMAFASGISVNLFRLLLPGRAHPGEPWRPL